jgi:hypothetical protein
MVEPRNEAPRPSLTRRADLALLLLAAAAVYAVNLDDYFIGDDFDLIGSFYGKPPSYFLELLYSNESGDVWATWGIDPALGRGFIRPVKIWLLKLDFELWGTATLGYHVTSTLFFVGIVAMVHRLLCMLLPGRFWLPLAGAWVAAIHPVFSEVVPFITAREEVIAVFFSLLSFHAFLRFRTRGCSRLPFYLFYAAALFTKESAISAVGLAAAHDLVHGRLLPPSRRRAADTLRVYLPVVVLLVVYFALRYVAFGNFKGGDAVPTDYLSPSAFLAFHTLFYRSLFHPTSFLLGDLPGVGFLGAVLLAGLLAFVILRAGDLDRARVRELIFLGPLWYLCSTAVLYGTYFAGRRNILPVLGLILFLTVLADSVSGILRPAWRPGGLAAALLVATLLLLPPTVQNSLEYQHAARTVSRVRAEIDARTSHLPPGSNVFITHVPQWQVPPYYFGWALRSALKRPFTDSDLANHSRVVELRNMQLNRDRTPPPQRYDAVVEFDPATWSSPEMERRRVSRLERAGLR